MSLFGLDTPGAYGPGAGTIRPPVDNSHKGTFPVGSIFYVCQRGDLLGLERIVDKALHVRIPCATCSVKEEVMGLTPLHVASEAGQLEIVEYLLRANVEVGCEDKFLVTPLHLAALEGHTEICAALIAAQAPLAAQDVAGDEPIHWAATKGQDQVIKLLLKAGSHLDAQNHEGWTPLHRAAFTGRPAAVRALIDAGANLSTRTHRGDTPLHLACFSNALTAIEELIKRDNFDRNARNCKGLTPFGMCLTEEAKALMRMYGAEAPTDRVPPPQHNLKLTATATAAKSTDAGAAGADAAAAAAAAAAGGDPGPAQQDGGMLQQHLAHWHATATEEGAPGFSRLAQQATCVPSPPQELERQGQGEGVEGDISSVEGDVDMERVSAELLKITSLRKRELEEFPDPENPGLSRELGEDTRYLSNDFMAEVSSGFSAGANPYNLMRNSSPPLGGHGQESTITGTPITEGPSGTDTPTSSSPASSAFPSKRASLGCDAPFPSNSADPPVPIVAHPPVEPKNGRRERPRGPTKMRPSNSFTAALGRASAPVMDKLGGTGSRSFVVRAPEPPKTGPTTALPPRQPIWGASPMASRRASESQVSIASRASEKKSGEGSVVGGGSSNSSSKVSSTVMPVAAMPQRASETGDIMLNFPVPCPQALRAAPKPSNLAPLLVREASKRSTLSSASSTSMQERNVRRSSMTNVNATQSKWEYNIRLASDTCFVRLPSLSRAERIAPGGGAAVGHKPSDAKSKFLERYSLKQNKLFA